MSSQVSQVPSEESGPHHECSGSCIWKVWLGPLPLSGSNTQFWAIYLLFSW